MIALFCNRETYSVGSCNLQILTNFLQARHLILDCFIWSWCTFPLAVAGTPMIPVHVGIMTSTPTVMVPSVSVVSKPPVPKKDLAAARAKDNDESGPTTTVFVGNISQKATAILTWGSSPRSLHNPQRSSCQLLWHSADWPYLCDGVTRWDGRGDRKWDWIKTQRGAVACLCCCF